MLAGLVFALALALTACGGGGPEAPRSTPRPDTSRPPPPQAAINPERQLGTARFTTHQPEVLEQVGAHHAYARGLSGRGVRIGIQDTIVDYTQRSEFGNRVRLRAEDGAVLSYSRPFGDDPFSDIQSCLRIGTCSVWRGDSVGDEETSNTWVQQIVSNNGWPERDDSTFIVDEHFNADNAVERLFRWSEVPVPYGQQGAHGTIVASVAAGTNLGVAPGAAIIPIAINLSDDQIDNALADTALRFAITLLPRSDRLQLDDLLADSYRDDYEKFDIINRSYGIDLFDPDVISANIASELDWYRRYLPKTLDATLQIGTPESQKTILVYAAGNANQPYSGIGADLPYYLSELRGHSLSVVATDPQTGTIASYSNRCGSLPPDWNTVRHGRHYCLAAPGTVRGLVPDANTRGYGNARGGLQGTSFAAPVVSGALALLKEHFRGTRGNTEIVKRMIDTADRSGRYADLETYGAGHLDIASALSPVGALNAGQSAQALAQTALRTPAAFGALTQRTAALELAAFDAQNFPFWIPLPDLISTPSGGRSPIPEISDTRDAPAPGLDVLGLHWAPFEDAGGLPFLDDRQWAMGFGQTSASLARLPRNGEWGYGLSLDNSGYLDSETSGAFGSDLQSGTIWTSRVFKRELGEGWMLNAEGTLALSMPQYQNKAIFQASSSVMSAMSLRAGTQDTGISLEQPLRAETGTGTFRIENGRIENGRRLYDKYHIPLPPDARELRLALRHEEHAPGGKVAFEVGHSVNAGHVPGETETRIGFAYRTAW